MAVALEIAQQALLDVVRATGVERIALEDGWQRVLAEAVVAGTDFPPFDRSPLDGYAVIAQEVAAATPEKPVILVEQEHIGAGEVAKAAVRPGRACRIMTGAPLPAGATGVVRVEDTRREDGRVLILHGAGVERNICRRGEEIALGETTLKPGQLINTGVMGTLALLGHSRPLVYKRPRVGILVTGSELSRVDDQLAPGKIRDSNSYMLSAQVKDAGAEPVLLGMAPDDLEAIRDKVAAAPELDMILTTGGVSVGDYDFVKAAFRLLGVRLLFERVDIKPGMPVIAGVWNARPVIGLSGNPAAASISFEQVVRPALLKMGGRSSLWRQSARGRMAKPFGKGSGQRRFVWAYSWLDDSGLQVEPLPQQGNGMLKSAMSANSLIALEANSPPVGLGENIQVILF